MDAPLHQAQKISKPMGCLIPIFSLWLLLTGFPEGHAGDITYSIQIGAFRELGYAKKEVDKLREAGRDSFYRHEEVGNGEKLFRVYVEKYEERGEAETAAKQLKHAGLIKDYGIKALSEAVPEDPLIKEVKKADAEVVIEKILLNLGQDGTETLSIHSSGFFWPSVLFSLGETPPKLVMGIDKARTFGGELAMPSLHGNWIKGIRNLPGQKGEQTTIILELAGGGEYEVTQEYDEAENTFNLTVSLKKP